MSEITRGWQPGVKHVARDLGHVVCAVAGRCSALQRVPEADDAGKKRTAGKALTDGSQVRCGRACRDFGKRGRRGPMMLRSRCLGWTGKRSPGVPPAHVTLAGLVACQPAPAPPVVARQLARPESTTDVRPAASPSASPQDERVAKFGSGWWSAKTATARPGG